MAEEQGQAPVAQPALEVTAHQAVSELAAQMVAEETAAEKPRAADGKFAPKEPKEEAPAAEAPAEEAPAEETPEITPEKRRYKLKYKGEELEKDEDEVVSLAQQGFDYTQKSQAIAKEREEIQVKIREAEAKHQRDYEQRLQIQRKALEKMAGLEDVDLNKLSQEDPVRAQQEFFKRVAFGQQLQAIEAEQQQIAQQRQSEQQAAIRKQAEASVEALQTKIPGWGNEKYAQVLKTAVKDYGFQQHEVNAITDHRAIEVLHDAMQWRALKAAKPQTVDKKVASVPKVTKPGTTEKPDPKAQSLNDGMARLQKSGSRQDAQSLVMELMKAGRL